MTKVLFSELNISWRAQQGPDDGLLNSIHTKWTKNIKIDSPLGKSQKVPQFERLFESIFKELTTSA